MLDRTESYREGSSAFTLGSFIMGKRGIEAKPDNFLFQHEYGHYIQSQTSGLFYLPKYATPSLASAIFSSDHDLHRVEQDANIRAFKYFNKYVEDFNYVDEFSTQKSLWNFLDNPIKGYDNTLPFDNSINQSALSQGKLKVAWYEWFFGANITF